MASTNRKYFSFNDFITKFHKNEIKSTVRDQLNKCDQLP